MIYIYIYIYIYAGLRQWRHARRREHHPEGPQSVGIHRFTIVFIYIYIYIYILWIHLLYIIHIHTIDLLCIHLSYIIHPYGYTPYTCDIWTYIHTLYVCTYGGISIWIYIYIYIYRGVWISRGHAERWLGSRGEQESSWRRAEIQTYNMI